MRIPLATPLRTRVGDTSKDARLKNAYAEVRGEQSVVRHRPSARGGVAVGTGTAQGGIGLTINGTDTFIGFWGDTLFSYTGSGTSWAAGVVYLTGSRVSFGFVDYYATEPNISESPPTDGSDSNYYWTKTYTPPVPNESGYKATLTWSEWQAWYFYTASQLSTAIFPPDGKVYGLGASAALALSSAYGKSSGSFPSSITASNNPPYSSPIYLYNGYDSQNKVRYSITIPEDPELGTVFYSATESVGTYP